MKRIFTYTVLILIVITFIASDIFAIPAFARKYNMTCKTCHSPFPNLKPYGEEFAGNGFVLKDQDAPRYFIDTGDPELSLIRDLPLAMRLEGYVTYNQNNSERSDFNTPVVFKLLSGGSLAKGFAYYLYYALEHGKPGKIEDAWLMFNNLFGSEINLTIGQFQVSDPLFVRELRLTREDYAIYKVKPGDSNVNLAYDRGIMLEYGFEDGPDISFLVVNGSGIGEEFFSGTFDNDKYGYTDKAGKKQSFKEGDWKGLADAISGQYGAGDLYNNEKIATDKSFDDLQAGDLVGWKYNNGSVYHNQTVTKVGDSWWFDFDEKNDYYKTIQGSLSGGQGVPAYEKEYDIDAVKNASSKQSGVSGTKARSWNFKFFDKHK